MPKNNNIKVFDKLVSKTKVYLVIIAILLIAICFYEHRFIMYPNCNVCILDKQ